MEKGLERDDKVWTHHNIRDLWHGCWQMCRQTMAFHLCMCSDFSTLRLEQTIMMSLYDVTRISHVLQWEGTINGEHDQAFGAAVTIIWVF